MIDDATEEVLHESDAMTAFFGYPVQNILSERIFEAKRLTKNNDQQEEDLEAQASGPEQKREIIEMDPRESARTQNSDGPANLLLIDN